MLYLLLYCTDKRMERERLYQKARHDEASALYYAEQQGEEREREKWQEVVAQKDALIAKLQAQLESE